MTKNLMETIRAETTEAVGPLNEEVFQKALAKAKRWMRNAYGSVNLSEYIAEGGGSIAAFYEETLKEPAGRNTFNRQTAQNRGR